MYWFLGRCQGVRVGDLEASGVEVFGLSRTPSTPDAAGLKPGAEARKPLRGWMRRSVESPGPAAVEPGGRAVNGPASGRERLTGRGAATADWRAGCGRAP